jgi:Zn finger protein HypA/HybF involved in hydrogenase expression
MFLTNAEILTELRDIMKLVAVDDGDVSEVTFKRADLWRISQGLKAIEHSLSAQYVEYEMRCWDCGHKYTCLSGDPGVAVCPECGKQTVGVA